MKDKHGSYVVNIWCLGRVAAQINGEIVPRWRPTKSLSLLCYLLERGNHLVDRSTLTETFWPDGSTRAPETSLKVAVHALRRLLGDSLGPSPGPLTIETCRSGYMLRAQDIWYDVSEFERCIHKANRLAAEDGMAQAIASLHEAVRLYRGEFFIGITGEWISRRRQALADQYLHALIRLAEVGLSAYEYHDSSALCLKALNVDPCCERAYQILMLCQAGTGQPGGVGAWYDLCTNTLSSRLDTGPSLETERLFRALRQSSPGQSDWPELWSAPSWTARR